jgi:SAM-dependent methyltransferase
MTLITTNCYNCNSADSVLYDVENGYNYVRCSQCSLIYLNPRPSDADISVFHQLGVHRGESLENVSGKYKKGKIKRYLTILKDFYSPHELKNKRFLDIGCGFGEFLESVINYTNGDIKAIGSEPNEYKRASCRERGLSVDFIDLDKTEAQFDVISLLNVYSHLPHPVEFLKKIKSLLKPNGELFLETGHSSHLPVKHHHKPYHAPDHLSFANKEIVENILGRIGFDIVKTSFYRLENLPKITDVKGNLEQVVKTILGRDGSWSNLLAKYPIRDMFIRVRMA